MPLRDALSRPLITRVDMPVGALTVRDGAVTLARVLAPDGLDAAGDGRSLVVGASHIATLEVVSFPPELGLSWTSAPALGLTLPGVTVHQRIDPLPDALARRVLTQSSDAALRTLGFDADEGHTADTRATQGADEASALLRAIADGTDRMATLTVSITCAAPDAPTCAALVQTVREQLLRGGVITRLAQFEQLGGYQASLPLGTLPLDRPHDVSMTACAMGMPIAAGGIRPRPVPGLPIVWGCHRSSGVPIVFDRWQATNPHLLVVAESGSGKSLRDPWAAGAGAGPR